MWGATSLTMPTPVRDDIMDVPIDVVAPRERGRYWIIVAVEAEPAGGFTLSRTNWTLERPIWNDGNDLAHLPDSTVQRANAEGWVMTPLAFRASWPDEGRTCVPAGPGPLQGVVKYCDSPLSMFGVRVVVE